MTFENILSLIDKFDESKSSYMEIDADEVHLKLKKADMCKKVVSSAPFSNSLEGDYSRNIDLSANLVRESSKAGTDISTDETATVGEVNEADLVKSPLVGVFYSAPSPDKPAFVQVGSKVEKGDTVCLIESMKMMSQVTAPKSGVVKAIFVENESDVEYDTPLFEIG